MLTIPNRFNASRQNRVNVLLQTLLTLWCALTVNSGLAAEKPAIPLTVSSYDAESNDDQTIFSIRLDQKLTNNRIELEDHGTFLQVIFPNAIAATPGKFVEVKNSAAVEKIVSFQTSANQVAVRFFTKHEAGLVKKYASAIDLLGERLMFSIDNKKLMTALDPTNAVANVATKASAEADKTAATSTPSTSEIIDVDAASTSANPLVLTKGLDLSKKLGAAAAFCAVMILLLLGTYFFRHRVKGWGIGRVNPYSVSMKTIGIHTLNNKQRLEVLEIDGEKILLSINPNQVSYLTTLGVAVANSGKSEVRLPIASQISSTARQVLPQTTQRPQGAVAAEPARTQTLTSAASARPQPRQVKSEQPAKTLSKPSNSISTKVGGDIQLSYERKENQPQKPAAGDVTRLIREKLKNLPNL